MVQTQRRFFGATFSSPAFRFSPTPALTMPVNRCPSLAVWFRMVRVTVGVLITAHPASSLAAELGVAPTAEVAAEVAAGDSTQRVAQRPLALPADVLQSTIARGADVLSPSLRPVRDFEASGEDARRSDRFWLLDVRRSPSGLWNAATPVRPSVYRLDRNGCRRPSDFDEYLAEVGHGRPAVVYVHGNRYTPTDAVERGLFTYRNSVRGLEAPVDWVIWSWPSSRRGILGYDVRLKAARTDGQAFLFADLLRQHHLHDVPTTLIGFSFGGRIITGALHVLAGGSIHGRVANHDPIIGANFDAGLIAPAIEQNWMAPCGYHGESTKNLLRLTVLYNSRDAVLKRYWLIDRIRGQVALGYEGPRRFATRYDGTRLPVRSRDCSPIVGLEHDELDYYTDTCGAGPEMASLILATMRRD